MQNESDEPFWCYFNWLSPKLEFWLDSTMEGEVGWLDVKCTDRWVMTYLFTHDSKSNILSTQNDARLYRPFGDTMLFGIYS